MSEFIVYSEKKAFDEIIFNGNYPNLKSILSNHARIFLNLSKDELEKDISNEGEIFYFLHAFGGAKKPEPYPDQFQNVNEDESCLVSTPRSVYFLNVTPEKAKILQEQYGVIVQSCNSISDNILKGVAHYELPKDTVLRTATTQGWSYLLNFSLPPSNSIVITDDWLFKNEETSNIVGEFNLVMLLDAILPNNLSTEYHILIITDDQARPQQRCEKLVGDLKAKILALRTYPIIFEVVFAETIHKRKAILNYISITCDKGFAMFRLSDLYTVRDDNDFRYENAFNRSEKNEGHTVFYSDSLLLKRLQQKCNSVKEYIKNRHQDPNQRILGDCKGDKTIINRLINDV